MYKIISWLGHMFHAGNLLLADYILVAQRLELLGFTYHRGKVAIVEPVEGQKYVSVSKSSIR